MAATKPINIMQLGDLAVDDAGRLYWKGKIVQTESVVVLSGQQKGWGVAIAIATMITAIATLCYSCVYIYATIRTPTAVIQQQNK